MRRTFAFLSACSFSLAIKEIWEADLLGNTLHLVDKGKISAIFTWIFTKKEHTKRITLVKISFSLWPIFRILPGRVLGLETSSYKQSWLDIHFFLLSNISLPVLSRTSHKLEGHLLLDSIHVLLRMHTEPRGPASEIHFYHLTLRYSLRSFA